MFANSEIEEPYSFNWLSRRLLQNKRKWSQDYSGSNEVCQSEEYHPWRNRESQLKSYFEGTENREVYDFTSLVFDWRRTINANFEVEEKDH